MTLDGLERDLDDDVVLIEDADGPTSLGGVMGGQLGGGAETTRSSSRSPTGTPNINRTMARLSLRSEAGARYEKGLAPEQTLEALTVATRLLLELTRGKLVPGTIDVGGPGAPPNCHPAALTRAWSGCSARPSPASPGACSRRSASAWPTPRTGWTSASRRSRRNDVTREADVIEEVARSSALDTPCDPPAEPHGAAARLTADQRAGAAGRRTRSSVWGPSRGRGLVVHLARHACQAPPTQGRPPRAGGRA